MDNWQAIQNWLVFVPVVGGLAWYYMPRTQTGTPNKAREHDSSSTSTVRRKIEQDTKPRVEKKKQKVTQAIVDSVASVAAKSGVEPTKKKKQAGKQVLQQVPAVQPREQDDVDDELDMSTRQFAAQMQKARQGQQLSSSKNTEKRVKTVKLGSAMDKPVAPSGASLADEETSTASATYDAGDVSDMLEPAAAAPKALRVTAPSQPQKQKLAKQPKKDEVETKKQRQNRLKVEERKLQREAEEKERKALEERQRRTAREARGEPAKNGTPVSMTPASSAWNGKATSANAAAASSHDAPLLDTFDADSSSSSVGGPGASTGPSSVDHDAASEEEQLAQAMQQSVDESGWTTVAVPKKQQKKKAATGEVPNESASAVTQKLAIPASRSAPVVTKSSAKPSGFQALEDQYTQRTDADPNDASNWDA